jgi:hypothetical protein
VFLAAVAVPGVVLGFAMHAVWSAVGFDVWLSPADLLGAIKGAIAGVAIALWWRERTGREYACERAGNARYIEGFRDGHDVGRIRR